MTHSTSEKPESARGFRLPHWGWFLALALLLMAGGVVATYLWMISRPNRLMTAIYDATGNVTYHTKHRFPAARPGTEDREFNPWKHEIHSIRAPLGVSSEAIELLGYAKGMTQLSIFLEPAQSSEVGAIVRHRTLRTLQLTAPRLTNTEFETLKQLDQLDQLAFAGANVDDQGLAAVSGHPLSKLHFEGAGQPLDGKGLHLFGSAPRLQELMLTKVRLTDDAVLAISRFTRMENLYCRDVDASPDAIAAWTGLTKLKTLSLTRMPVGDPSLDGISRCTHLTRVELSETRVGDAGVALLSAVPSLSVLDLERTVVTDASAEALSNMPKLTWLVLKGTQIGDATLERLQRHTGLRLLNVEGTRCTRAAIEAYRVARPNMVFEHDVPATP
jgi:hypothetical protein